jgi:4-amino-4-deoxy-L-arabinose transferase-like glycosyltransferase
MEQAENVIEPRSGRFLFSALLTLAAALAIGTCAWGDLYNETDGQYGAAAKVMATGGSWLIPENNGVPRLVKPPLLYWAMAASMKIFGINEFSARLPGALAVVFWTAITFLFGAHLGGRWRGFLAGSILLTSLGTFTLGRIVMPEPLFSAFIAAALYCVMRGHDDASAIGQRRQKWFAGFWLFASLACFAKGWHGLLYPLAIVGLTAILCPASRSKLRRLFSWQGLLLFGAINLPWYVFIESKFPGWLQNLLLSEHLGHVVGNSNPANNYTSVPRWQFLLLHLAWFFPWSIVAIITLWKDAGPCVPLFRSIPSFSFPFALIFSWGFVIFASVFLVGQRQDYYAMSMWPVFALGTARLIERQPNRSAAIVLALLLGVGFLGAVAIPFFTSGMETASVAERVTAWTTVTNFDTGVWASLRTTAVLALGGASGFCLLTIWLKPKPRIFAFVAASACLALGATSGISLVSPFFSLAKAAPAIKVAASPGTRLVFDGALDTGSSLLFYTDLPVTLLNQEPDEDFFVRKFGLGRHLFLTEKQLEDLWKSDVSVILVTEVVKIPVWEKSLGGALIPIARCGTQVVLKN